MNMDIFKINNNEYLNNLESNGYKLLNKICKKHATRVKNTIIRPSRIHLDAPQVVPYSTFPYYTVPNKIK